GDAFRREENGEEVELALDGSVVVAQAVPASRVTAGALRALGRVVVDSDSAALLDMGDGVLLFETRSKMNTLGRGVIDALHAALDRIEGGGYAGLVIGNDDPRTFSAGADLLMVAGLAQQGNWKALDASIRAFQETSMRLRSAPFPIVAAAAGMSLGGGCEFSMHCDLVQAHAELYTGLVEVGVGVIPSGGGTKELLFRFTNELAPY